MGLGSSEVNMLTWTSYGYYEDNERMVILIYMRISYGCDTDLYEDRLRM